MSAQLLFGMAAGLGFLLGLFHSIMGERGVVTPLLRLEKLPGEAEERRYKELVIRSAWHLTTVLCWAISAVILTMAVGRFSLSLSSLIFGATFLFCGVASLVIVKGRHPSWFIFLLLGGILTAAAFMPLS